MSNVPPPKSNTAIVSSFFLSRPYASAAAVGSLTIRMTSRSGDLAGVFGRLALRVVEVGGNGDDGLLDLLAEIILGRLLHLLQDHRGDFRRAPFLAARADAHVAAASGPLYLVRNLFDFFGHFVEAASHESFD